MAVGPTSSFAYMTKFPVNSLDDFKGRKIRSFGFLGLLVKKLGGAPVSLPGTEQYLALQRGTVDGTIYAYYTLDTYKLKEVVSCVIMPPVLAAPAIDFYASAKAWEGLPEDLKEILTDTLMENLKWYSAEAVQLDAKCVEEAEHSGVKVFNLPEKEVEKLRVLSLSIWDDAARKSDGLNKLIGLLKVFLREKGVLK